MNVHYLFGEPSTETTPHRDYLRDLLAEATPLEETDLAELKKKPQA